MTTDINNDLTDVDDVIAHGAEPAKESQELSNNDRLINHLDRQAQIIEQQASALKQMQERLDSFGRNKDFRQESEDEDSDDSPAYLTKKQMAQLHQKYVAEAEKRVAVASFNEKLANVRAEIEKPEVAAVLGQLIEKDPLFKESFELMTKSDPIKAGELALKRANQILAKRAAKAPKPLTSSSTAGAGNGAPTSASSQGNKVVTSINGWSTQEDRDAFAKHVYNTIMKR